MCGRLQYDVHLVCADAMLTAHVKTPALSKCFFRSNTCRKATYLFEVIPKVVKKYLLLHVVSFLHDAKHVGNLLLLSSEIHRLSIVQHFDIAGQASVFRRK